jgi:hypothetical protein
MIQVEVLRTESFTCEEIALLSSKYLDTILINAKSLNKNEIIDKIRDFRDELDKYT